MILSMGNKLGGSYILDICVLSTGETALIEVNLGFKTPFFMIHEFESRCWYLFFT
jgi:hypothetical protein